MDIIAIGSPSDTPWTPEEWNFSSSLKNGGEFMVQYSNRILDLEYECDLNDITQQKIMAMIFICSCRSPQFRKELRRHGIGVSWQFRRKEAQGWDRSLRCEEQNGDKALNVTSQKPTPKQSFT